MYFPVLVFNNGFLLLPPQDSYYNIINNVFIYNISPGQAGTQLAVEGWPGPYLLYVLVLKKKTLCMYMSLLLMACDEILLYMQNPVSFFFALFSIQ